ncbi:MAG: DNA polymerase III, subunit gamma and tau [Candidatus Yonathbacteria bacterium RIFCSPHIGHO2_01_FULL_44_41]|uniref:DNA polymerase III subunit gamma/tau n=1 Tax=Candidatus Yonathbacteria bacterium RIFCSPHIGHO2_02_FULL_44_14 TaxID=1802724 RepID=A0A1G2S9G7_9BACT|nr:MAG: DNA polymerase III, subunit gamma and tau [Candidatus Yonathbacteria bacterium RIFCSPHIGHO2_01_FULL_44_41]OHA81657.1 MAG: DNA polymerase III, subunit gamma and tau [Candidatus Yonathbacteria bacterium RIFCSPHIGHO2_02_FULL_44_14]OHA81838.1 MAG: DNA polymerase III, subunit gamma and tau [Candidatus Yonathbacteria bacterium RIFCSPLOWO2_01_FULL_43_20]
MSSNLALYTKYRPKSFEEVIGQEQVVKTLLGAIKAGNIGHAYLFCGSRGTGKTSIARIFARAIGAHDDDIYEIDAASNRGIDDIRALRDAVHTVPMHSPYKVYIIDEAHMLSREAFPALLKTLEEPPRHVVFILATTDENKIPETIVSRCQSFRFEKPSQTTLKTLVEAVAKKEGYALEPASSDLIALLGEGSFRDTLGILQKVIASSSDKKISQQEVEAVTGAPESRLVNNFLRAIVARDVERGLSALANAIERGVEEKVFLDLLLRKMRAVMMFRFVASSRKEMIGDFPTEDMALIEDLAKSAIQTLTSKELAELLRAYESVRVAVVPGLALELALLRIAGK